LTLVVQILSEIAKSQATAEAKMKNSKFLSQILSNWARENWPVGDISGLISVINVELAKNKVQLFVKTSKATLAILVSDKKTVFDLKNVVEGKEAIPVPFQLLMYNGKVLRDEMTLLGCGISNESTIHLGIRGSSNKEKQPPEKEKQAPERDKALEDSTSDWKLLLDFCLNILVSDFEEQSKTPGFLKLDAGTMSHVLQQDDLAVFDERLVLDAIVRWAKSSDQKHEAHAISRLLPLVRFPYMDTQTLLALPYSHPRVVACPGFKTLLQEALQFQISRNTSFVLPRVAPKQRPQVENDENASSSHSEDSAPSQRTKRRKLYKESPAVNVDQFFSYVVSTLVHDNIK